MSTPNKTVKSPARSGRSLVILAVILLGLIVTAFVQGASAVRLGLDLRGGSGIGLAVARQAQDAGARVLVAGRSPERLALGTVDISRDWGWAPESVEAMWEILQHNRPDDFVVATGRSHSLREFVDRTFAAVGIAARDHVDTDPGRAGLAGPSRPRRHRPRPRGRRPRRECRVTGAAAEQEKTTQALR